MAKVKKAMAKAKNTTAKAKTATAKAKTATAETGKAFPEKEWTLMFYFASDNPLAAEIVTQLKAIKQAGFHQNVNVVAQFDPNPVNAETHIFDVNRINKIQEEHTGKPNKIGFVGFTANDPYVVNLMADKLWRADGKEGPIREQVIKSVKQLQQETVKKLQKLLQERKYPTTKELDLTKLLDFDPPVPPLFESRSAAKVLAKAEALEKDNPQTSPTCALDTASRELPPQESLKRFLTFCSDNYPARHYILFILGHGIAVGNDTFLLDEHAPVHFLRLTQLRELLDNFKTRVQQKNSKAEFELVSFHSCSLSSLEVACELKGTANYMLASQSPSFVGSWPYRQILIRIFNFVNGKKGNNPDGSKRRETVKELLTNIFHYCLYNSYDFLVAGYSSDLCLCDLRQVSNIEGPVSVLADQLIKGLGTKDAQVKKLIQERILLSHLEAQSYFNENYADLFDFCFRLQQRFEADKQEPLIQEITKACDTVIEVLKRGVYNDDDGLIVRAEFVGPVYQYSHGLSVYFPWSQPIKSEFWPNEYNQYRFVTEAGKAGKTWSEFLKNYFLETRRHTRVSEFQQANTGGQHVFDHEIRPTRPTRSSHLQDVLLENFATGLFNVDGELEGGKPGPDPSAGAGCDCQSIKNHPPFTREPQPKGAGRNDTGIPVIPNSLNDPSFRQDEDGKKRSFVLDGLSE